MRNSLWLKFLLLLLGVTALALSATVAFRELMLRDFRAYLEGDAEERRQKITANASAVIRRGSSAPVEPLNKMISSALMNPRSMIPLENASRSPRNAS